MMIKDQLPAAAYLPHLTSLPHHAAFLHKPEHHPFFLNPASSFHFSSLFSGDLGKPGRRRKARTVFSDAQLAGLERRFVFYMNFGPKDQISKEDLWMENGVKV